jgi:hypothetical protein
MSDPISDEALEEILLGLEGLPPSPWRKRDHLSGLADWGEIEDANKRIITRVSTGRFEGCLAYHRENRLDPTERIAQHFARLSPETIKSMIARIRAADDQMESMRKALSIAAESDHQWQDIKTAPKDGTPILTYWPTLYGIKKVSVRSWQKGSWQGGITEGWADCFMQIKPNDQPSLWAPIVLPVQP